MATKTVQNVVPTTSRSEVKAPLQGPNVPKTDATASKKAPPIIRGSTRDILVGLYANLMKIDLSTHDRRNIVLENAIKRFDAPVAAQHKELIEMPNRLQDTTNGASASIEQLKNNKETKDLVTQNQYPETLVLLRQKVAELGQKETELKTEYLKLVDEQTKVIREMLISDLNGKKPDPQAMVNLEVKQVAYARAVKAYLNEHKKTQEELDKLHLEVYTRAKDKTALPTPEKMTARAQATPGK